MNAKISTFFICIEAIIYLLYTLHGCTFNISEKEEQDPARGDQTWEGSTRGEPQARKDINNNDTTNNGVVDKRTDKLTEDDKELFPDPNWSYGSLLPLTARAMWETPQNETD